MKQYLSFLVMLFFSITATGQNQRPTLTIPIGHQLAVNCADFSSDNKLLVTGSLDNSFIVWDTKTGFIIRRVRTSGPVQQVLLTPDGTQLVTVIGQSDATVSTQKPVLQKWDLATGKLLMKFPFTGSVGLKFLPTSGYLLVPNYSTETTVTGKPQNFLEKLAMSSNNSDEYEDSIQAIIDKKTDEIMEQMGDVDLSDPKKMAELQKKIMDMTMEVRFGMNPFNTNITLLDFKTLKPVVTLKQPAENVVVANTGTTEFILTQPDPLFAIQQGDKKISAWNVEEIVRQNQQKTILKSNKEFPLKEKTNKIIAATTKGLFAIENGTKNIQVWQLDKISPIATLSPRGNKIADLQFSPDGEVLYVYSNNNPTTRFIDAWNTTSMKQIFSKELKGFFVGDFFRLAPAGDFFTAGGIRGLIKLSLSGDSTGQFMGKTANAGYAGFKKNDKEVYVNYDAHPDISSLMRKSFEQMIDQEAREQKKVLSPIERDALVKQKMFSELGAFSWKASNGFMLNWDLVRGGAGFELAGKDAGQHKNNSIDNNYYLINEKIESSTKFVSNMFSMSLTSKNKSEEEQPDEEQEKAQEFMKYLLDPKNGYDKFLLADSTNGPVTVLINRKTKDSISLINIDSTEWVMLLKTGYYMTSQGGAKSLSYTRGLEVFPFEQFDIKYNRPDLVLKAIGLADQSLIDAYKNAYYKRIKRLAIDTSQFKNEYDMPEAIISNKEKIQSEQKTNKINLMITASDKKAKLDRFNIWINEVPVFGKKGKSIKEKNSNNFSTTVDVVLSQGMNRIETSVTNANGIESYRSPIYVKYIADKPLKEKLWFIGIGIDQFADNKYNLKYSAKDIRDLSKKLKEKYKEDITIDTLFNKNVTVSNIKALKQKLQQTTENDKVIVAYSGHGMLSKDYDYFLSTYAVNFEKPEQNGLPYDELENLLDSIPARKKLMLIDACHSGEVDKEDLVTLNATSDSLIKGLKPIAYKKEGQLGLKNSFELMQSLFVNVGKSTGATIISAAAGTQFALERNDLKNGVFTYSILEAMKTSLTMKISELKTIVSKRVNELTKGLQKPTSRNETIAVDWNVW